MAISAGSRLGPYEIVAAIGAGGMGEVYKARDTRLDRTVAIKVLPAHLSASAESRQRFEREAKTISSLSHPHICALYDVGNQDGVEFLVMEYLEGETLSDRLVKGPLAFDQVLRFGCEIADALDKAHRQGIVHRDLKPGNVMLTKSGLKLLDFGLAKSFERSLDATGREQAAAAQHPMARMSLTSVPTAMGNPNLTAEGTILGTFQYMAPEQLEGREADARTDIFAFGAVLYEMATGKKAFSGRSQASLISSIMTTDPMPVSSVTPAAPPVFDRVIRTCLAKEPDDRWQTAHDVAVQLRWIQEGGSSAVAAPVIATPRSRGMRILPWILAALATAGLIALLVRDWRRPEVSPRVLRLSVLPPEKTIFTPPGEFASTQFSLSPDGRSLAFVAAAPGTRALLWVRTLDNLTAVALAGTEDAAHPFWSPDSRSIGFFTPTSLKRVEASGGAPQKLCDSAGGRGGVWSSDGVIVFSDTAATPLLRVPDSGGDPEPATRLDASRGQASHRYPSLLPDGRRFLFWSRGTRPEHQGIYVASLGTLDARLVLKSEGLGVYSPPGYVLTVQQGMLVAFPFDEKTATIRGRPQRVAESIPSGAPPGYAPISVSANGLLAFSTSHLRGRELVWLDRTGQRLGTVGPPGDYSTPDVSPDEKRVAVSMREGSKTDTDVWLFDTVRAAWSRFSFDPTNDRAPKFSPDGTRILYASASRGPLDLYEKPAGGAGEERLVVVSDTDKFPSDWSRDGRFVVYHTFGGKGAWDLWVAPVGGGKPFPFLDSHFTETQGVISPDGRWMAYSSDESGRFETYVTEFPKQRGQWQLSTSGGMQPAWRADGKELFYVAPDQTFMSVELRVDQGFEPLPPVPLFKANFPPSVPAYWRYYVPSTDGKRFLVSALLAEAGASPINVVLNWTAGLKKKK